MTTGHPRDITDAMLQWGLERTPRPDLLRELVAISRQCFGFFPKYSNFTQFYPWVAARLEAFPAGSRFLDIGAGLNPLPMFLARRGGSVDCIDPSKKEWTLPVQPDWNEWGFFDYSQLDPHLTSHRCGIEDFDAPQPYDAIYAVGTLQHVKRRIREAALQRCRDWLKPKGSLVLAFDLRRSTDFIWNKCEGVVLAPPEEHGSTRDVVHAATALGFAVQETAYVRDTPENRTDLFFLHCRA